MPSKRSGLVSSFNSSIYVLGAQSVNGTFVTMHSTTRKVKYGHLRYRCQHLVLDWRVAVGDTIYAIGGK